MQRSSNLVKLFTFEKNGFSDPKVFSTPDIGFSTKKTYDNKIQKLFKNNTKKHKALIFVYVDLSKEVDGDLVPIIVEVHSGYEEVEKFILVGLEDGGSSKKPLNLHFEDEVYYKLQSNKFLTPRGEKTGDELLNYVFDLHIKTTKRITGLKLRFNLFKHKALNKRFVILSKILVFIYNISFAGSEKISLKPYARLGDQIRLSAAEDRPNEREELDRTSQPNPPKPLTFLGYTAEKSTVTTYCALHLIVFFVLHLFGHSSQPTLVELFSNPFLVGCYIFVSLAIWQFFFEGVFTSKRLLSWIKHIDGLYFKGLYDGLKVW